MNGTSMAGSGVKRKLYVEDFNECLVCPLCHGYLINPTAVDNCRHTYCRSCIVKHLMYDKYCPQCKSHGGKINASNLISDDVLRRVVLKLIPGLYHQERDRILQFLHSVGGSNAQNGGESKNTAIDALDGEDFFSPTEPISLSLEYHSAALPHFPPGIGGPPVRYLQCPAGLRIHHLKRFLCSKYDVDPNSRHVAIDIFYEDDEEILRDDFTLMDVCYLYRWERQSPMKFRYRILVSKREKRHPPDIENQPTCVGRNEKRSRQLPSSKQKTVTFLEDRNAVNIYPETELTSTSSLVLSDSKKTDVEKSEKKNRDHRHDRQQNHSAALTETKIINGSGNAPVKMVIARRTTTTPSSSADQSKKSSLKRSGSVGGDKDNATYSIANDFKSLRSNDVRYSTDYAVTTTATAAKSPKHHSSSSSKALKMAPPPIIERSKSIADGPPKCDIVVSIPHSQVSKVADYASEDDLSLFQLKTANKKTLPAPSSNALPPNAAMEVTAADKVKPNVPKLKIELNSLKTKLSIPKPKSADAYAAEPSIKKSKHRKHSLDETSAGPLTDRVDLETYAKNIGLKPIEVLTPTSDVSETNESKLKYSPSASPMSSSSCSTTSSTSSNGNFSLAAFPDLSSMSATPSHKKHKKKHSKEPKNSTGKRKKLHAEIYERPDESLKMKVKITASHAHKSHKKTTGAVSAQNGSNPKSSKSFSVEQPLEVKIAEFPSSEPRPEPPSILTGATDHNEASNVRALNQALSEESQSIKNLMRSPKGEGDNKSKCEASTNTDQDAELNGAMASLKKEIAAACSASGTVHVPPKRMAVAKDTLPASLPLPPSLFKTSTPVSIQPPVFSSASGLGGAMTTKANPQMPNVNQSLHESKPKMPNTSTVSIAKMTPTAAEKTQMNSVTMSSTSPVVTSTAAAPVPAPLQFAVPYPPKSSAAANLQRHYGCMTPSSIASAFSRELTSQAKRSAAMDDTYLTAPSQRKQPKLEKERPAMPPPHLFVGNGRGALDITKYPSPELKGKRSNLAPPDINLTPFLVRSDICDQEQSKRKAVTPMGSPFGLAKMVDSFYSPATVTSNSGTAIRSNTLPPQLNLLTFAHSPYSKASLEIMRIPPSPADVTMILPKSKPMMGPPLTTSSTRSKKLIGSSSSPYSMPFASVTKPPIPPISPPLSTVVNQKSYRSSPPALTTFRNSVPLYTPNPKSMPMPLLVEAMNAKKLETTISKINAALEVKQKSLREFRPPQKESNGAILDLSSASKTQGKKSPELSIYSISGGGVDGADGGVKGKKLVGSSTEAANGNDDLQNLHLLSESATAREKISIKSKPFEKPKLSQPSLMMRQQNASVRNIPNPSALAFRNQPAMHPVPTSPATAAATATVTATTSSSDVKTPPLKSPTPPKTPPIGKQGEQQSPPVSPMPKSPNANLSTLSLLPRPAKKHPTIDQVAASLNMRAAAKAEEAAVVSTTSTQAPTTLATTTPMATPTIANSSSSSGGGCEGGGNKVGTETVEGVESSVKEASKPKEITSGGDNSKESSKKDIGPASTAITVETAATSQAANIVKTVAATTTSALTAAPSAGAPTSTVGVAASSAQGRSTPEVKAVENLRKSASPVAEKRKSPITTSTATASETIKIESNTAIMAS